MHQAEELGEPLHLGESFTDETAGDHGDQSDYGRRFGEEEERSDEIHQEEHANPRLPNGWHAKHAPDEQHQSTLCEMDMAQLSHWSEERDDMAGRKICRGFATLPS